MKITDYAFPVAFLVIFAICAAIALVNGAGGIKKLLKGQRINRKTCVMSVIALALAVGTLIPSVAMWPRAVDDGSLTNAETGLNVTFDDPAIPMSGDRTNAQLDEFLREGFGEDYEAVWNGNDADVFMFTSDQDKILANEAYLQSLGLKDTGFRNGVCFPTTVLTAEVIKDLPNMTDEELAEVFNQHRWLDVYWHIMTIPGYCDMWVQDLEEYPEYVEQNDRWLPALKELLAEAKASPDGMDSLLVKEADGTEHYCDAYRYGAAKVCASLENAVIRGVAMDPQSIMNWELPSFSPEIADRWTVKLTEPEDQENKPAAIWAFPNVKSGQDAYTDGVDLADLRAEKFAPDKPIPTDIDNPDPGTPPAAKTHKVWSHHVIKGSNANLENSPVYQEIAEGKDWQTTWRTYSGYTYDSCSHKINGDGVVTGTMGTEDIHVYFYYVPNQDTKPTYVNFTVLHVDEYTGNTISQTGPNSYVKGAEQAASKESMDYYVYAGYYTINGGSKVYDTGVNLVLNEDTVVRFYYNPEYMLTTKFVDVDTGEEIRTRAYDYFVGGSQFTTTAPDNIDDYERVSNSETSGNPKTVTGTMPYSDKAVTFYYKKVVADQTVTAYYRAIDSNHNLTDPIVQTKKVGESYSTQQLSFGGYRFRYTTGSPTSGTVGNQPVVVTYWYELIKQDGNNNKDPGSDSTQNGNANPPKGPDDTTNDDNWQSSDPDNGTRVPEQSGNDPTSNHRPTDNPGGQAAGSDERQEVSDETVNGIVGDNQETPSSGTGGQDPGHVDTGATEVPGGGYTPPAKEEIVPDNPPSSNDPVIGADEVLAEP